MQTTDRNCCHGEEHNESPAFIENIGMPYGCDLRVPKLVGINGVECKLLRSVG